MNEEPISEAAHYDVEGEFFYVPGHWKVLSRNIDIEDAEGSMADLQQACIAFPKQWRDFRIVKVVTTRYVVPKNK